MIEFLWPMAFAALLLPFVVMLLVPAAKSDGATIRVPFGDAIAELGTGSARPRRGWRSWLGLLAFIALVVAAARPVKVNEDVSLPLSGRDIMLAVDISASMGEMDWQSQATRVTRMTVVKKLITDFIRRRQGDRVGVVVFGSKAYLLTPLTFDLESVADMLNDIDVGMAGPATAMGDAIGLTIKRLREADANHRVAIVLSDGAANAGWTKPEDAALVAATESLTVYTIGVGTTKKAGVEGGPTTGLDEETLKDLAGRTGGKYFLARGGTELEGVYQALDELEPVVVDEETARSTTELYPWPAGFALVLSLLIALTPLIFVGGSRQSSGPSVAEESHG